MGAADGAGAVAQGVGRHKGNIANAVARMPLHQDFLEDYCAAAAH